MNRLYFGDNLKWLSDRKEFPDASIDLVYLAAPFNSRMRIQDRAKQSSGLLKKIWRPATVGQQLRLAVFGFIAVSSRIILTG